VKIKKIIAKETMKKLIFKIVVCLSVIILFTNCSKDNNSEGESESSKPLGDYYFTAKVSDAEDFEVEGFLFASNLNISDTSTSIITGATYEDESRSIAMGLTNIDSPGTYTLLNPSIHDIDTSSYVTSLIYGENDVAWHATYFLNNVTATVTITEFNESSITGTFHFIGVDIDSKTEKAITEGQFRVKRL